jgi:hypothetical protein
MDFNKSLQDVDHAIRSLEQTIGEMRVFANGHTHTEAPDHQARVKVKEAIASQRLPNALQALKMLRTDLIGLGGTLPSLMAAAQGDIEQSRWNEFAGGPHQQDPQSALHDEQRPDFDALGEPGSPKRRRK